MFSAVAAEYLSLQAAGVRIGDGGADTKALLAPGECSHGQQLG